MKRFEALILLLLMLFSTFAVLAFASAETAIHEEILVVYAIPPTDDSMTNPHYTLLQYRWYTTFSYWINPKNKYGFSSTAVVNTITTSANT